MFQTYFYLSSKRTNKRGLAPIYCRITDGHFNRCDYATQIFVNPIDWNRIDGWVFRHLEVESALLQNIKNNVKECIARAVLNDITSAKSIVQMLKPEKKRVVTKLSSILTEFFDHYKVAPESREKNEVVIRHFELCTRFSLESIDTASIINFEKWLRLKGNSNNTISKKMQLLDRIFKYAIKCGYINKNPFDLYIRPTLTEVEQIHLTSFQQDKLFNHVFSQERLAKVRDLFMFQCFTGLAYVDLTTFNKSKIVTYQNKKYLVGHRQKSKGIYHVFWSREAEDLASKYDYKMPIITNAKYNSYLKEVADIVGININLTTHIGRKTFAQNMINKGFSWESVAHMMGHKKTTMTEKHYAHIGLERIMLEAKKAA